MKKLTMVLLSGLVALLFAACDRKDQGSQEQHNSGTDEPKSVVTPVEKENMGNGDMKKDEATPMKEETAKPAEEDTMKKANGNNDVNGQKPSTDVENDKKDSE